MGVKDSHWRSGVGHRFFLVSRRQQDIIIRVLLALIVLAVNVGCLVRNLATCGGLNLDKIIPLGCGKRRRNEEMVDQGQ